ncbi:MAG: regulatory iron-sulfur-containing complex subunit RicT [Acidobacteriota bacterium]
MGGCGGCSFKGMSTAVEDTFVGVRFGDETNLTLCRTDGELYAKDERVIVELEHGPAFGRIERSPMPVFKPCQKSSAIAILRRASDEDRQAYERKLKNEIVARAFCRQRSQELKLEMKISKVDFNLSGRHATFYFTANGRVDFRQLVRDLARRFSTRVKMVQVGPRDEAALLGGVGICGRTLCCSTWLKDFKPISIQMAKRQNLSLNPSKISGQCGRLLCCLAYEDPRYQKPKRRRPAGKPGSHVKSTSPRDEGGRERSKNRIAGGAR